MVPDEVRSLAPVTTSSSGQQASTATQRRRPPPQRDPPLDRRRGRDRRECRCRGRSSCGHLLVGGRWRALGRLGLARAPGDRLLLEPDAVPTDELVGDHHGEHDDALGDRDDVRRDAGQDLQRVASARRGTRTAARRGRCRSGCCDRAGRPRCRRSRDRTGTSSRSSGTAPKRIGSPDQAGDRAGEQHRGDDHPLDVDAAGRRRRSSTAGGAEVEAEAGLVEQNQ